MSKKTREPSKRHIHTERNLRTYMNPVVKIRIKVNPDFTEYEIHARRQREQKDNQKQQTEHIHKVWIEAKKYLEELKRERDTYTMFRFLIK